MNAPTPGAPSIFLEPSSLTLEVGKSFPVNVSVTGASNPSISYSGTSGVTTNGTGSGVTIGCTAEGGNTVTVTVASGGRTYTAVISVSCRFNPVIDVTPGALSFTHTVGTTGCPQRVGTFRVTNVTPVGVNVTLATTNTALTFDTTGFALTAGASRDVVVSFNCSTQTSFAAMVNVTGVTPGGSNDVKAVQVTATINR